MKYNKPTTLITLRHFTGLLFLILAGLAFSTNVEASPPNPGLIDAINANEIDTPYFMQHKHENSVRGIGVAEKSSSFEQAEYSGSFNALAVLIEFSDKPAQATTGNFDTLLFVNQTGSLRHYYNEVSYGQFDVITVNLPSSMGWNMAPETYAYYCNGANGTGSYPQNSQGLCEDIVSLIDPIVDFSNYDNDNNGYVDGIILIHSGPGAEMTGSNDDIWSHMWAIPSNIVLDGVRIFTYSVQPEYWFDPGDMTCGVYCHEFGHILGLPDLYDTTPSMGADSYGIGSWSLMAYGSWNGSLINNGGYFYYSGDSPAHFDAWSRIELGFAQDSVISENITNMDISNVENGGKIYKIWMDGDGSNEYFLVENRQNTGYDSYLPDEGLLIWHIDESQSDNNDRWYPGHTSYGNFMVALEQADGNYDLEQKNDKGDSGDPFPGVTGNTEFSALTDPSTNTYANDNTGITISNISSSADIMTADIQVSILSGTDDEDIIPIPMNFVLEQNYPNPFNPATRIEMELTASGHVSLTIFDILGRKVKTLLDGNYPAGNLAIDWNGEDSEGHSLASGVYFYQLTSTDQVETRKMLLVR